MKDRGFKINWIQAQVKKFFERNPEETISINKIVSAFAIELASTKKTGDEIIKQLAEIGFLKIEGDNIVSVS